MSFHEQAPHNAKPIGYHYTHLSPNMAVNGILWPITIQVKTEREALQLARKDAKGGADPHECHFGCLTVYDNGEIQQNEFSPKEIEGDEVT